MGGAVERRLLETMSSPVGDGAVDADVGAGVVDGDSVVVLVEGSDAEPSGLAASSRPPQPSSATTPTTVVAKPTLTLRFDANVNPTVPTLERASSTTPARCAHGRGSVAHHSDLVDGGAPGLQPVPVVPDDHEDAGVAVGRGSPVPVGEVAVEGGGRWLVPGLWDTHMHHAFSAGGLVSGRSSRRDNDC